MKFQIIIIQIFIVSLILSGCSKSQDDTNTKIVNPKGGYSCSQDNIFKYDNIHTEFVEDACLDDEVVKVMADADREGILLENYLSVEEIIKQKYYKMFDLDEIYLTDELFNNSVSINLNISNGYVHKFNVLQIRDCIASRRTNIKELDELIDKFVLYTDEFIKEYPINSDLATNNFYNKILLLQKKEYETQEGCFFAEVLVGTVKSSYRFRSSYSDYWGYCTPSLAAGDWGFWGDVAGIVLGAGIGGASGGIVGALVGISKLGPLLSTVSAGIGAIVTEEF